MEGWAGGWLERRARTIFVIFLAGLVVGGVALLETVLARLPDANVARAGERPFAPPRELILREYQPHARFAFAPPDIRRDHPGDHETRAVYRLDTDGDGFIQPARVHANPAITVAFLGGSTTETMYVDPENRFPHLAARLLGERLGVAVNGLNAGRSGNNTLHASLLLSAKVVPLRPDVVVLMEAVNDLGVLSSHGSYWTGSRDLGPLRTPRGGIEPAVQRLRDETIPHTWRAVKRATRSLRPDRATGAGGGAAAAPSSEILARWVDDYEAALRQFVGTAKAWNIQPVLMTQARLSATDAEGRFVPDAMAEAHAVFNDRLRVVAADENVPLIDLATLHAWSRHELYDGLHFNDTGSLVAARIIAAALEGVLRPEQELAAVGARLAE
jgi:lysophospholipase L1-like esterase